MENLSRILDLHSSGSIILLGLFSSETSESILVPQSSGYYYCTNSLKKAWTLTLYMWLHNKMKFYITLKFRIDGTPH